MTDLVPTSIDPIRLWQKLTELYSLEDLRSLCFTLGVDFENLPGEGKEGKARELVIYCRNRAMVEQLVEKLRQERPKIEWGETPSEDRSADQTNVEAPAERLYTLVKAFNQNRHQPISSRRTRAGDDIAFKMRELAPELDGQFDVAAWLRSANMGKRVAAVEFLDWKQDIEYFEELLRKLFTEKPFVQFHILIAIKSLLDQLSYDEMQLLRERLTVYDPEGDGSRNLWSQDLQKRVEEWFKLVD